MVTKITEEMQYDCGYFDTLLAAQWFVSELFVVFIVNDDFAGNSAEQSTPLRYGLEHEWSKLLEKCHN